MISMSFETTSTDMAIFDRYSSPKDVNMAVFSKKINRAEMRSKIPRLRKCIVIGAPNFSFLMRTFMAITDRASFESYDWTQPDESHFIFIRETRLPAGMKIITNTPSGVLENVVGLVGYERLCYWSVDDPELLGEVFDAVGSRLVRYYEVCAGYENVGACFVNDDWGFKTQTMLRPAGMRRYVVPWHKRIVEVIHAAGKPALLHSCGNLGELMEDVIEEIGFDAKHSFEDSILPIEDAYERWGARIALLGGIDVDFLCRSDPATIKARCRAMLERAADRGGYALGSGNSIPEYVPDDNFLAMTSVALDGGR